MIRVRIDRRLGGEIEVERRAPLPGNRFRFRVRACRACGRGEAAWAGERKSPVAEARPDQKHLPRAAGAARCPAGVPLVSRVAEARPDQMTLPRRPVPRGVPPVSRRCPAGSGERCRAVSRRCPDDDDDDGDDDDVDDGAEMMMMVVVMMMVSR